MALRHWLQLSLTCGIGPILSRRLVAVAGNAEAACAADAALLRTVEGIGSGKAGSIATALRDAAHKVNPELECATAAGVQIICTDDASYPLLLRDIPDPPCVLYVRGTLEPRDLNALAIVGSRKCTFYGREQAERFAALLAGAGMTVVSGGARGVDSATHRGALSHPNGRTIAILGCGTDVTYPPENAALFTAISARGAVISEYPMGAEPARENFPRRNRIISGMSRGVLIVEADERSGALITARQAYDDQSRPVFAVPGRVDNPLSVGPHRLIRDGAILTTGLEDILDGLTPLPDSASVAVSAADLDKGSPQADGQAGDEERDLSRVGVLAHHHPSQPPQMVGEYAHPTQERLDVTLTDQQRRLLDKLGCEEASVDQIIELTALPAQTVLQELTYLTLKGVVQRVRGQVYVRRNAR